MWLSYYLIVGVERPTTYRCVEQLPVTGHAVTSVLRDPEAPPTNRLQYFENAGSRALIADGWKAVCRHEAGADYDTEAWELYDLTTDPSECHDLAADRSERLAELQRLWWEEAERHGVLPLDDRTTGLFGPRFRDRSPHPSSRRYVYRPPMSAMPGGAAAPIGGRSFDLTARVTRADGDDGVLYATGTQNAGVSVFVQDGRLVADYNAFDDHTVLESPEALPTGDVTLGLHVRRTGRRTGTMALSVDGTEVASTDLPLFMSMISSVGPSVGEDQGSPVSTRYEAPFGFEGTLHAVEIQILSTPGSAAREAEARAEMSRQ